MTDDVLDLTSEAVNLNIRACVIKFLQRGLIIIMFVVGDILFYPKVRFIDQNTFYYLLTFSLLTIPIDWFNYFDELAVFVRELQDFFIEYEKEKEEIEIV